MAGQYARWLETAEKLASSPDPRLRDVPLDMFADVHDQLARLWGWQKARLAAATGNDGDRDPSVAAELARAIPRTTSLCHELETWIRDGSNAAEIPRARLPTRGLPMPPLGISTLMWAAEDGGVVSLRTTGDAVDKAQHLPGDTALDERFLDALEMAGASWRMLNAREHRSQVLSRATPRAQLEVNGHDLDIG